MSAKRQRQRALQNRRLQVEQAQLWTVLSQEPGTPGQYELTLELRHRSFQVSREQQPEVCLRRCAFRHCRFNHLRQEALSAQAEGHQQVEGEVLEPLCLGPE